MLSAALLAITIAFPKSGQLLPYVERSYMIGAVKKGTTEIQVGGAPVSVYRTGAWCTTVPVVEGTNTITISGVEKGVAWSTNHVFVVAKPGVQVGPVKPKVYEKLPYAGDTPIEHPYGKGPSEITVVIDAGHGGHDTGAISPHGFFEKDANLAVARALKKEFTSRGYNVVLTRDSDVFIELYDRPKYSYEHHADAFISVHHNAPGISSSPVECRHTAVYAWNAIGENLAKAINDKIANIAYEGKIRNLGVPRANFAVIRNPEIPSCLLEIDFIGAPEGEETIWNVEHRRKVAAAIADGFARWCEQEASY